jgi:PKD repeat protein
MYTPQDVIEVIVVSIRRMSYVLAGVAALTACEDQPTSTTDVRTPGAGPAALSVASEPQRVLWRRQLPGDYSLHSPGVGADGTIYVSMTTGKLHAIAPDGTERWTFPGLGGAYGPVSVGADGMIYVAGAVPSPSGSGNTGAIFAITPAGTQAWVFNETKDFIIAGPNVGPDGNIYAVADYPGIGLFSLTPQGQLRFSVSGFTEYGPLGHEIAFGSDQLYFAFDMNGTGSQPSLFAYDLNGSKRFQAPNAANNARPAVGPNGNVVIQTFPTSVGASLTAYTPAGSQAWFFYEFPGSDMGAPDVGPDNVAYAVRNSSTLHALNADGTERWRYTDGIMSYPRVRPGNDLVFMGGRIGYGKSGWFLGLSTNGTPLWRVDLPDEPGFEPYGQLQPMTRPVFSPDGSTAYVVVDVLGDGANPYAYLYAISVGDAVAVPPPPPPPSPAPPVAPSNLTATAASWSQINLAWVDNSTNESGFKIERCEGAGCTSFAQIGTTGANATSYSNTGLSPSATYRYRVRAFNGDGNSGYSNEAEATTLANQPNQPPVANANGPYNGTEGTAIAFSSSGTSDPDGDALSYHWDFGDGTTSTLASPTHAYADNGTFPVTLTVTDAQGAASTSSTTATVANAAPVVTLEATSATTFERGESLSVSGWFTDNGLGDAPWHYAINWGDGTASTTGTRSVQGSANPIAETHRYRKTGTYYVHMTVTDKDGTAGRSARITVTVTR